MEDGVLTPIIAGGGKKRRRPPLESHPENPKIWPPFEQIYPLVVQSILEQNVFGVANPITQRLIDLAKSADVIKIRHPEQLEGDLSPSDGSAASPSGASAPNHASSRDQAAQQLSSAETQLNEDLSPSAARSTLAAASIEENPPDLPPPTVQMLADGALTAAFDDVMEEIGFETVVDRPGTRALKDLPQSTADASVHAPRKDSPSNDLLDPMELDAAVGYDSTEEYDGADLIADFEVVRPQRDTEFDVDAALPPATSKGWEDSVEAWREFDDSFGENAFAAPPAVNVEPNDLGVPREDSLFWGSVSGGVEETLGIEEQYKKVARAEAVSKEEAYAINTLGWEFRCKSVIPGCKGIGRKELSTIRYSDVAETYQPEVEAGDAPARKPSTEENEGPPRARIRIPARSAYGLLASAHDRPENFRRNNRPTTEQPSYLDAALSSIERQVENADSVRTTMAILRHMMTEPKEDGTRVYDVSKILNPNPPLLRSVVMDMNVFELRGGIHNAGKAAALHAYQSLIPLVARYLSRPEPPGGPHRENVPPHKRLKRAPNEEPLPIKHPESVNMLQICKFITEHLLRDYSLWQSWGEILSVEKLAEAEEAELWRHHQRWNSVQRVISTLAGGASDYSKTNEIILAWLRGHKAITDPLGHVTEAWSMRLREGMREIPLQWLTPTNDEVYLTMDPYKPIHKGGMGGNAAHRRDLASAKAKILIHAPVAWTFPTAMPKMTSINLIRHFRPDFRTGLFHARYFVQEGVPYTALPAGRSTVHKTRIAAAALIKNKDLDATPGGSATRDANSTSADQSQSSLWGTWTVQFPTESVCLTDYNIRLSGQGASVNDVGQGMTVHPADVLQTTDSLSIGEWCPLVIMEHTAEPQILPLPGMVSKIIRYYRPGKELYSSPAQAETKLGGRLGHFGSLKILGDRQPQLFGCPLRIKPNQGISIIKTSVYAGICLVHPFDQRRPLPLPEEWLAARERSQRPTNSREGLSSLAQFNLDFRLTDFLLIRTGSYSNTNPKSKITLRPLFYGFGQAGLEPRAAPNQMPNPTGQMPAGGPGTNIPVKELYGIREQVGLAMESYARTGLYTLGQLAPMTEIPTPDGKRINEWRKLWVESYCLRQASSLDTSDMTLNKNKCIKWFQGIFDTQILQKIILPLKNSIEENTSVSFEKYLQSNRIKTVSEEIIQKILTPEQICGVISSQYGLVKLIISGIRYLRNYDRLPIARTVIQQRDFASDAQWARLYAIYARWISKRGEVAEDPGSPSLFSLPPPYRGMSPSFRIQMSIVARMIEELVIFSPWNQWKCYQEISIKKNAQFLLGCVFDESFGRGENVCFLKEDINQQCIRDQIIPMITKFIPDSYRQLPITRFGIDPTRLIIFEDSKRGIIQEINTQTLQVSLLRSGFSPNDIAVMSRPELINAVYRFNFAITPNRGTAIGASGRLDLGDYYSRINDIINRHKNSLQNDVLRQGCAKDLTDVFDEAANPKLDHLDLELSLTEGLRTTQLDSNALENQMELELMKDEDDEGGRGSSTAIGTAGDTSRKYCAPDKLESVCTHEQLIGDVWSLESVLAPDSRLGAGPPMGLVTKEEGDKFEKELPDKLEGDSKLTFPPSNSVNGLAIGAWLKGLPDGEVKDILVAKQYTAVPCLRWIRRVPTVGPATGGRVMNKDKVVLIYGSRNIQKFLEWRRRRLSSKFCKVAPTETPIGGGGSSVSAKRQGGSATGAPSSTTGRRAGNRTDASIVKKMMAAPTSITAPAPKRPPPAATQNAPAPPVQVTMKSESHVGSSEDLNGDDGPPVDESSIVAREVRGCLPVNSVRLTSRQQRLLQERVESGAGGIVNFSGTPAQASEELNNNLGRLIMSLKKPEKKFVWFWDRVNEKDAPNYYTIVKTPMWLNYIQQKCTQKEYKSVKEFEDDIKLIHFNCFAYNPDGHWIRPLAEQLVRAVQQKLRFQRLWLEEVQKQIPA